MNKYLLDTNIIIHYARNTYGIKETIAKIGVNNCYISEITLAELKIGDEIAKQKGYTVKIPTDILCKPFKIIPIASSINFFAQETARLQHIGRPLHNHFDLLIGATSVVNNMIMVTENLKDFENIENITIENWVKR